MSSPNLVHLRPIHLTTIGELGTPEMDLENVSSFQLLSHVLTNLVEIWYSGLLRVREAGLMLISENDCWDEQPQVAMQRLFATFLVIVVICSDFCCVPVCFYVLLSS